MSSIATRVPSPAERPEELSAEELIHELRARGGRIYCFQEVAVICLTSSAELAAWLHEHGASPYVPRGTDRALEGLPLGGAYRRARGGTVEWDFYVHLIPVVGEETVWEAAGRLVMTVQATEFA